MTVNSENRMINMPGQNTASVATKGKVLSKGAGSGPLLRFHSLMARVLGHMLRIHAVLHFLSAP